MPQRKFLSLAILLSAFINTYSQNANEVTIAMDKVSLAFHLQPNGTPEYKVDFNGRPVVNWSSLGFALVDDSAFSTGFELLGTQRKSFDETWQPVWGEVKSIRNNYEELKVRLRQKKTGGKYLDLVFRVFADGVGFRYEFPKQKELSYFIIKDEFTRFNLSGDHKAFWIPGDYDSNEYPYTTSLLSQIDNRPVVNRHTEIAVRVAPNPYAVQTPLMLKTAEGLYINIHEAAQSNYPAMQLIVDRSNFSLNSALVPDASGNKAYLSDPSHTPWRTIIISDKAADILNSKLILNLNEPPKSSNFSWIKPMKFVGVWWEMQTGKAGWNYSDFADSTDAGGRLIPNNRHGANTANVKKYIDFAARSNIQGVLVEGWNVGWEDWFGNWKENVFDFVTPYPDFNVKELNSYARSKGVQLIMHNETSGSATNYERLLDTAFRFMNKNGYRSVKTGYVGRIIPRGEHHDGQWMTAHYVRTVQKALQHKVMIDIHESVRPTGLHRTYPNWLANEAARGNEFNAFSSYGNPPEHETILPFTRLIGGPMDYTPGIFKLRNYTSYTSTNHVHTTLAKQLALYVTMYSPLQMAADFPENYDARPDAFQFIKDVPVDWEDTKILEAEPGDYITIARREKGKADWFIGSVTDENSRNSSIKLNFLHKGVKYKATIYKDATDSDWKTNPEAYAIENVNVDYATTLNIRVAPGGGYGIRIQILK